MYIGGKIKLKVKFKNKKIEKTFKDIQDLHRYALLEDGVESLIYTPPKDTVINVANDNNG